MKYTSELDRRKLLSTEVQGRFDDIDAWVNTHLLEARAVPPFGISARNIVGARTINLCSQRDPVTVAGVPSLGWYKSDLAVAHQAALSGQHHHDDGITSYPTVEVTAFVGVTDSDPTKVGLYKMCIGVTTDGGVTWTPLDGTGPLKRSQREFGDGCGTSPNYYATVMQTHYMTGLNGYYPKNFPSDRAVRLVATFGGDSDSFGDPTVINGYCVMFNAPPVDPCTPWGFLTLDATERA